MANDGQIVFEITADGKHVVTEVQNLTRLIDKESKNWENAAEESTDNIGNSFSSMLKKIAAGFSAAKIGKMLLDFSKDAIEAASDLQEVQNVVDATFGASGAAKIEQWAKSAGTQFGLTETQAKKFTSTLGAMAKSSGLAGDEIITMSTDLAGLAADMASFYNLDFDTAFQKIRSGISGETEPLKQLGINMSVANLNAYALQQGLQKTFEQMDQGEQTMLRYQYIMSATADAQGDFARTSEGYANSIRTLETNITTLKTNVGNVLLEVIEPLVAGINKLFPEQSTSVHTVLDDFADIDSQTLANFDRIENVAKDARDLNQILSDISSENKASVIGDIASGANKLKSNSVNNWNNILGALQSVNGLENIFGAGTDASGNIEALASALAGATVDQSKADAWQTLLSALSANADAVSKLTGDSVEGTKQWLEDLAKAANTLDEGSADGWDTLLSSLLSGIDLDTQEGKQFRDALEKSFLAMGNSSEQAAEGLAALGYDTDAIIDKQRLWLETCRKLVQTIPGLSDIINTETGEVKGGTQAITAYIDEWEKAQKKMVYMKAIEDKNNALAKEFSDFADLEIKARLAVNKYRAAKQQLLSFADQGYSIDTKTGLITGIAYDNVTDKSPFYRNLLIGKKTGDARYTAKYSSGGYADPERDAFLKSEAYQQGLSALQEYSDAFDEYNKTLTEYWKRKEAYNQAVADLEEYKKTAEELVGELDSGTVVVKEWSEATINAATEAVAVADAAMSALADHVENVRKKVQDSVNGIIKGFEKIKSPLDDLNKKSNELAQEEVDTLKEYDSTLSKWKTNGVVDLQKMSDNWDKLTDDEKKAYNALVKIKNEQKEVNEQLNQYTTSGMKSALSGQLQFMNEYIDNLNKAQALGLSNELLAMLSDGSAESAEYLKALIANPEGAKEVDDLYQQVQKKKEEFTQALTEQQLSADQVYQSMLEEARKAVEGLDLEEEAKNNSGKTVAGIAQGIADNVPAVKEAVDSIIAQLERLNLFGITLDLGDYGRIPIINDNGSILDNGSFATGLDYVPFDGFLATLHAGESILTAEEAKVWRQFKNGSGIDYDAIGGVMRDNIKPGGNVYLDGRVVGSVISDQQGRSFRQLQRSGWQA